MKILDLGCGPNKLPGAIGVDIRPGPVVDVVHDLNVYPWPFADNEFDLVYASHVLEHLDDVVRAVEEIHRITKPGGGEGAGAPLLQQRFLHRPSA
ncbi:methyltransferase domain-containing protein [Desulfofundulus thermobenzoicus]|uniref:Methyltransferase domain-containing protein n=1 Tax=Desulfofundulus thermobenzoicus TaxID=29376 RepID=A0A6N7IT32_9FIRM|nr:class I SAM-dependent methyltransferase [Desulfofundulus thermobenzoicus]MQL52258.1 methyltransferase domain-containing protein [Desulfofundulus thermobenzoicus]